MNVWMRLAFLLALALTAGSCGSAAIDGPSGASGPSASSAGSTATATPSPTAQAPISNEGPQETDRVAELAFNDGDFYDVPDPLPPGEPGTLMRLQPLQDNEVARVYRVLYHSTSVDSSDVAVSGTIWVPAATPPAGGFPMVAWAAGNNGSGDPCAYSAPDDATRIDYALLMFLLMKERYVVAYTDYEGHGTRYPFLFAVGESATHSLIDAARAAQDLLGDIASDRVVIAGHSLGADAAAASLQYGPEYAGRLDIRGALVIEGGVDVADTVADTMAGGSPAGLVQGIVGWSAAYPELDAADLLTPQALRESRSIEKSCDAAWTFDGRPTEDVFTADPTKLASWDDRIEASRVNQAPFPVYFVVAPTSDLHVEEVRAVANRLCQVSDAVRFESYPGSDHDSVLRRAQPDYFAWIADRFASTPATGNCGT